MTGYLVAALSVLIGFSAHSFAADSSVRTFYQTINHQESLRNKPTDQNHFEATKPTDRVPGEQDPLTKYFDRMAERQKQLPQTPVEWAQKRKQEYKEMTNCFLDFKAEVEQAIKDATELKMLLKSVSSPDGAQKTLRLKEAITEKYGQDCLPALSSGSDLDISLNLLQDIKRPFNIDIQEDPTHFGQQKHLCDTALLAAINTNAGNWPRSRLPLESAAQKNALFKTIATAFKGEIHFRSSGKFEPIV